MPARGETDRFAKSTWQAGIASEVRFWDEWLGARGGQWPADFARCLDPELPIQEWLVPFIEQVPQDREIRILEIGSGPLTPLGKQWKGRRLRLFPTDPLADEYDALLAKHQIVPVVRTTWCHGEFLAERFPPGSFDVAVATNAVDHSYQPILVIEQALRTLRVGGSLVMTHGTNEAEHEKYSGLHQWNFCSQANDLVIWNLRLRISTRSELGRWADVTCREMDPRSVWTVLTKTAELPPSRSSQGRIPWLQLSRRLRGLPGVSRLAEWAARYYGSRA
jgi:SAM-dependent methyltransferase